MRKYYRNRGKIVNNEEKIFKYIRDIFKSGMCIVNIRGSAAIYAFRFTDITRDIEHLRFIVKPVNGRFLRSFGGENLNIISKIKNINNNFNYIMISIKLSDIVEEPFQFPLRHP